MAGGIVISRKPWPEQEALDLLRNKMTMEPSVRLLIV